MSDVQKAREVAKALAVITEALDPPDAPPPPPTRNEIARAEYREAVKHALAAETLIEPTADERRNGWTAKTLTTYVTDQRASQEMRVDPKSSMRRKPMPRLANSKYRPHHWRGR